MGEVAEEVGVEFDDLPYIWAEPKSDINMLSCSPNSMFSGFKSR